MLTETSAVSPGCSNQRRNDKIKGWKQSYYKFAKVKDPKQASFWMKMIGRGHWEPKSHDRVCSDPFVYQFSNYYVLQ